MIVISLLPWLIAAVAGINTMFTDLSMFKCFRSE